MESKSNSVINHFKSRSIFITGATGLVGKVLLEKLLRSCIGIASIYVLIRPSKKDTSEKRFEKLLQSSIFDHLKRTKPETLKIAVLIPGDLASENLGISAQNREILANNVSVIFHSAASINFNMPLLTALRSILEGTRNILELAKTMKNLSSFVYVSTAYGNSHLNSAPIEEFVYPVDFNPETCLEFFSQLDKLEILKSITPALIGKKSLTYFFSKRLAEKLVESEAIKCNLPVCIVRPSAVGPVYSDPIELQGWVDAIHSFLLVGFYMGHGLLCNFPANPKGTLDIIPVDFVAKTLILAAWETALYKKGEEQKQEEDSSRICKVYHACIDQFNPIILEKVVLHLKQGAEETPFSWMVTPPSIKITESKWWFFLNFFYVGLPCIFIDFYTICKGKKPRLISLIRNIHKFCILGQNINSSDIKFKSSNFEALRAKIPIKERDIFNLPFEEIDWESYLKLSFLGLRRHFAKEDDSTILAARQNLKRIKLLYAFAKFAILLLTAFLIVQSFNYVFV